MNDDRVTSVRPRSVAPVMIALIWLGAATAVGASGTVAKLQPPMPQIVLMSLVAFLLVPYLSVKSFRTWWLHIPIKAIIAIHLSRFVGIAFLVLYQRGELPWSFAIPGGIGDIVVATLAIPLLLTNSRSRQWWVWMLAWNALGLIDILMVIAAAAREALREPGSMAALLRLPLSLLPTFLVPIIVFSHLVLFHRAAVDRPSRQV